MIRDVELTYEDLVTACTDACKTCRWYDEPDIEAAARDLIDDAIQTAARYPAGTVLRMQYHRDRQQWLYTDDDRWLYIDDGD